MVLEQDDNISVQVIGAIVEYLFAPENPEAVLEKMADPNTKIISLTITEGGYNYDSTTGNFKSDEPEIRWDLKHPDHPKTVFGYLTRAFKLRCNRGLPGLTVLSCDNIQSNGDVCKKMLLAYVKEAEPGLIEWIEKYVSFPNSMVDRITPVTVLSDMEKLKTRFGIEDGCPVVCEPFIQWIVEDNLSNGRPNWELAGTQFVQEVEPYERMKIRLLNGGHSLLGFSGALAGYQTIDETIGDPLLALFLREYMDKEVTPTLGKIKGINIEDYKDTIIQRFANPFIKDKVSRICGESSAKIPKFIIPTIEEQMAMEGSIQYGAMIIALWCRYLELAGTPGNNYEIQDAISEALTSAAKDSIHRDPLSFLNIESVFGDLVRSERFVATYLPLINRLRESGVEDAIRQLLHA